MLDFLSLNTKSLQLLRYLVVAGVVYFLDIGGYILLLHYEINPLMANVVAKVIAVVFGFFAHRSFTYQIKNSHNIKAHSLRYFGLSLIYTPISTLVLFIFLKFISDPVLAKFICDILLFIAMYWINSKFTFLRDEPLQQQSSP